MASVNESTRVPFERSIVSNDRSAANVAVPLKASVSILETLARAAVERFVTISVSVPSPPSIVSADVRAAAMLMVSLPAPPLMLSTPPLAPLMLSRPSPPSIVSFLEPPVIVSRPPPPVTFTVLAVMLEASNKSVSSLFWIAPAAFSVPASNAEASTVRSEP